jgi:hypothetical protein
MKLPIGQSDFRKLIDNQLDFVDKSLFIKEVLDDSAEVILITRPRRFGKTLNMSMLHHFFAPTVHGQVTQGLFNGLKIAQLAELYMQHQGKYPVISCSFKDVKDGSFKSAYESLVDVMSETYKDHHYLLSSPKLYDEEKEIYESILRQRANEAQVKFALKSLTHYLYRHHTIKPILLIDEYDTPLQSAYVHGYYDQMVGLMRYLFSAALKDNHNLHKAVLTGILRIAKESLFTGLNNLEIYSLLRSEYGQYFGFTEEEVTDLLKETQLEGKAEEIKAWYNGYKMGETIVYNPWSIVNCIKRNGELRPYWVNTSDNRLIKDLMIKSSAMFKVQFELLLQGKPVSRLIDENFAFDDLADNESAIWSLLLFSGYLKAIQTIPEGTKTNCILLSPNQEVIYLYKDTIQEWFIDRMGQGQYHQFLMSLVEGKIDDFAKILKQFLFETASVFDVKGKNPEKFYHGFVLGLVASLEKTHVIKSNRESGYGRYDVMIIPKNHAQLGIILEFKSVDDDIVSLEKAAHDALAQITERKYQVELQQIGISNILKVGLAFKGKEVSVAHEHF